jgi:transcriptional regulator with XRE-family HTH domain
MEPMDREALADFLRRGRDRLQPADVGIAPGPRRRTPGLRRDDVANLAGISTDYLTRLEQARGPHPSDQVLSALARALRLTDDERDHLFHLAGQQPPRVRRTTTHVRPSLLYVLDALTGAPAFVVDDLNAVLVQNPLSRTLFGDASGYRGLERSVTYRWFTGTGHRAHFPEEDHPRHSRIYVADLRATWARRRGDADVEELVAALLETGDEFRELWEQHEVAVKRALTKRVVHPLVGVMDLDCETMLTPDGTQMLVLLTARPGTEARAQLDVLRVVGTQDLSPASGVPG